MPHVDGLQLFRRVKAIDPDLPVILISGHADIEVAVEAIHEGVYDFIAKPFPSDRLIATVKRAAEKRSPVIANRRLRQLADESSKSPLLGQAPAIKRLRETLRHVAGANADALVVGETGTARKSSPGCEAVIFFPHPLTAPVPIGIRLSKLIQIMSRYSAGPILSGGAGCAFGVLGEGLFDHFAHHDAHELRRDNRTEESIHGTRQA
jgi:response regulator receiver domain-containing protein